MRATTFFLIAAAVLLVVMALTPSTDARIPRRKLQKLKKIAGLAFFLKGKKKLLLPLPLPLPVPITHFEPHHPVLPLAEPWAFAEPLAEPLAHGHGYAGHGAAHFGGHHGFAAAEPAAAYW